MGCAAASRDSEPKHRHVNAMSTLRRAHCDEHIATSTMNARGAPLELAVRSGYFSDPSATSELPERGACSMACPAWGVASGGTCRGSSARLQCKAHREHIHVAVAV